MYPRKNFFENHLASPTFFSIFVSEKLLGCKVRYGVSKDLLRLDV